MRSPETCTERSLYLAAHLGSDDPRLSIARAAKSTALIPNFLFSFANWELQAYSIKTVRIPEQSAPAVCLLFKLNSKTKGQ